MRDPMRFTLFRTFNPQIVGYYQRMVLDRRYRIQLRIVGMLMSFFGLIVLTGVLDGFLKFKIVQAVSEAFLGLLWLSFITFFVFGLVDAIVLGIRAQGADSMFG